MFGKRSPLARRHRFANQRLVRPRLESHHAAIQPLEERQLLSINQPPTIAPIGPQNLVRDAETGVLPPLVFSNDNNSLVVVDDPDAGTAALEATLAAEHGTLNLAQVVGLTFIEGDGTGDALVSFTGSLASINAALAGMQFDADQSFSGVGTLTVSVDDLGNTGDGGAKRADWVVNIGIDHTDAPPTASATAREFVVAPGAIRPITGVSISDPDAGGAPIAVGIWSRHQGLIVVKTDVANGITEAQVAGNGTTAPYIVAPLSAINATFAHSEGVTYQAAGSYEGRDVVWFNVNDLGNTGSLNPNAGGWHNVFVEMRVTEDASISAPEVQNTNLNVNLPFSWQTGNQVLLVDPADGSPALTVTLAATNGALTLESIDPPTFSQGGNGQSLMAFGGDMDDLNAWLNTLVFAPATGFAGVATVAIEVKNVSGTSLDLRTVNIAVSHANRSPRGETTTEVVGYRTAGGALPPIVLSDPDSLGGRLSFGLFAEHGGFDIDTDVPNGVREDQIDWHGDKGFGITATLAQMNATLAAGGIEYRPVAGYAGPDRIALGMDDRGNSGPGGNRWGGVTVDAWVVDGVAISHPATQTAADRDLVFSRLNGNRIAVLNTEPTTDVSVTLTATHGRLTLGSTSGLTGVTGGNTAVVTLSGPLAAVNGALEGLIFHPEGVYSGPASIEIDVEDIDQTNIAATATVSITVDHINRPPNVGFLSREFVVGVDAAVTLDGISVTDADAGEEEVVALLMVSQGTLDLSGTVANGCFPVRFLQAGAKRSLCSRRWRA